MIRGRKIELMLVLGALSAFAPLSIDMYLPAFPAIQKEFAVDAGRVQWTLAAFFGAFAAGQTIYGPITDRWGRRRPLYFTLSVYSLASVLCESASSIGMLTAGRLLQGIAAAAGMVIARAVVRDFFDKQEAARVYSTLMLVSGLAPMLAPTFGSAVLAMAGWRTIFVVLAGLGLACLTGAHLCLGESYRGSPAVRFSPRAVLDQYRRIWRRPPFSRFALTGGLALMGLFVYVSTAPFIFIVHLGLSARMFGVVFGLNALGMVALAQVNWRLVRAFPAERVLGWGIWAQTGAAAVLLISATTGVGRAAGIILPLFLFQSCLGLILPNTMALAMAPFREEAGSASALLGTLQYSMAALISAVAGGMKARTPVPMAVMMLACAALAAYQLAWVPSSKNIDSSRQTTPS